MIRLLQADDVEAFIALRKRALIEEPLAFAASPEDDFAASADALRDSMRRAPDWVLFGAFDPGLVGTVGLLRARHVKASHKVHIWGMYVAPPHRGRGIGAELLRAAIDHARSIEDVDALHLGVSSAADAARRLYERAGFRVWGVEEDALRAGGQSVREYHMVLALR